jgi:hypothetical protein
MPSAISGNDTNASLAMMRQQVERRDQREPAADGIAFDRGDRDLRYFFPGARHPVTGARRFSRCSSSGRSGIAPSGSRPSDRHLQKSRRRFAAHDDGIDVAHRADTAGAGDHFGASAGPTSRCAPPAGSALPWQRCFLFFEFQGAVRALKPLFLCGSASGHAILESYSVTVHGDHGMAVERTFCRSSSPMPWQKNVIGQILRALRGGRTEDHRGAHDASVARRGRGLLRGAPRAAVLQGPGAIS